MGVGGQRHAPAAFTPEKVPVPIVREAEWAQGRSGYVRKISPPPGFDPRTFQPVASRYTDWAIPAPGGNGCVEKEFSGTQVRNWLLLASVHPINRYSKTPPYLTEPKDWFLRLQNVHSSGVVLNSVNSVHTAVLRCCSHHWGYLRLMQPTDLPTTRSVPKMITFLNFCILCKRGYHIDNSVILGYFAPLLCVRRPAFLDGSVASHLKVKGPRSNMDRWPLKMNSLRSLESLDNIYSVPEVSIQYEGFLRL